ncbi:putative ABC transporter, permease protein [Desulfonema limicola]|uniref:ABC transporter, permease protein n=1 Tax=Desulfonema limicola TaxID=45656 RepID=A0A975B3N3_9BACT|nr:iron ABC transporter permease [Desulfonema limicola]QTA78189.1 putative ABC transporter, permease protein [Desulfonema limicola]
MKQSNDNPADSGRGRLECLDATNFKLMKKRKPGLVLNWLNIYWLVLIPLIFLGIFYFYPLFKIFLLSLMPEDKWDLSVFLNLISTSYYLNILWFTFWQAAVSTILTIISALPGAYIFACYRFWGKDILQAFTTIPFVLPTVVVAAAFQAFLGSHGLVNSWLIKCFNLSSPPIAIDRSIWFILLAHIFYNYTIVLRMVGGFWAQMENQLNDAALMLGASPFTIFYKITLPLLRPVIFAAGLLVFIFCFSSFGVVLILGGPQFATLEVEIYRQAVNFFNLPLAAALSLIQIFFTFVLMWVYTVVQRKTAVSLNPESPVYSQKTPVLLKEKMIVGINIIFMIILLVFPLAALVIQSFFSEHGFSLVYYTALFENNSSSIFFIQPGKAIFYSLAIACAALLMALSLGSMGAVFLAKSKTRLSSFIDPLFMLPLSTSAVTLGFGFIIALDEPPLNLRTSIILVPIAHTLAAFPFVVRSLVPALRSIPPNLREAAALLGASPWKVWKAVDLPIVGRALTVAAVFAFTVSLGEFGATVFIARPQIPTMPLAIYRFLGQPGAMNYGQAMAMSSLLMMVTGAGFLFLEKLRKDRAGEF